MLRCLLNETPLEIKLRHEFRMSLSREHNFNKWIKGSKKMEQSKEGDRQTGETELLMTPGAGQRQVFLV